MSTMSRLLRRHDADLPKELPEDLNLEADAAARYAAMIGADLPMEERRARARRAKDASFSRACHA